MTKQKYLPTNISSLWRYPSQIFVIRYLDINKTAQRRFAWLITYWAPQQRLRKQPIETIQNILAEINPVIIASRAAHQRANKGQCPFAFNKQMEPWTWFKLTKIIYRYLCTKSKRIHLQASLSLTGLDDDQSFSIADSLRAATDVQAHLQNQPEPPISRPEDITMEKLNNIGRHIITNPRSGRFFNPVTDFSRQQNARDEIEHPLQHIYNGIFPGAPFPNLNNDELQVRLNENDFENPL